MTTTPPQAINEEQLQKQLQQLKTKLDKFKKKVLGKHKQDIAGISLLPPEQPTPQELQQMRPEDKEALKKRIDVLVVVHDGDREDKNKFPFIEKLAKTIDK